MIAKDSIRAAPDKQTFYADQGRRGVKFTKGEMVLTHLHHFSSSVSRDQPCAKLSPRWLGPFEISEVPTAATVRVKLPVLPRLSSTKPHYGGRCGFWSSAFVGEF